MAKIFISYRRDDSKDVAARLNDRLVKAFGRNNVFFDVDDNILAGKRWADVLRERLQQSDVLLVVIGPKWQDIMNERQDQPNDWTRFEVEHGLHRGNTMVVLPLCVKNAPVPNDLPNTVQGLLDFQFIEVRDDPDFHRDVDRLIETIKKHFVVKRPIGRIAAMISLVIVAILIGIFTLPSLFNNNGGSTQIIVENTATDTPRNTPTDTPTVTNTPTPSSTATYTATITETATATDTPTPSPTVTNTPTPSSTATYTATITETATATDTASPTRTNTVTKTATNTRVAPTRTPTPTDIPAATQSPYSLFNYEDGEYYPNVAKTWEASEDFLTWTLNLDEDLLRECSLTATDYVDAVESLLDSLDDTHLSDEALTSIVAFGFSMEAIDDYTVQVFLQYTYSDFNIVYEILNALPIDDSKCN